VGLTYSDKATRSWTKAVAAGAAVVTGPCLVFAIQLSGGVDAATLSVYNAVTAAGTDVIVLKAPILTTAPILYLGTNGTRFATGLSIAATGTAPSFSVFYLVE
jgi:hypothetical protein